MSLGSGYNFSDNLATNFGLQWAGVGYDAVVFPEDSGVTTISGSYDACTLSANLIYNFTDNQLTPYVGAGIGWTWIDTNIPSGPPSTGCWWDPWWGYVCYTTYPTKTTRRLLLSGDARPPLHLRQRQDLPAVGLHQPVDGLRGHQRPPRFDVIVLDFGWIF